MFTLFDHHKTDPLVTIEFETLDAALIEARELLKWEGTSHVEIKDQTGALVFSAVNDNY